MSYSEKKRKIVIFNEQQREKHQWTFLQTYFERALCDSNHTTRKVSTAHLKRYYHNHRYYIDRDECI